MLAGLSITSFEEARAQLSEAYLPMDPIPAVVEELPDPCDNPSTRAWGPDDQRGNLNYVTPERVAENLGLIRLGKVYGNLMVDLRASCDKLRDRSERIVMELTGLSRKASTKLLADAGGGVKLAIVMHFRQVNRTTASRILKDSNNSLREAIENCDSTGRNRA